MAECLIPSRFVHVTDWPTPTVTLPGWNERSLMETAAFAAAATSATPSTIAIVATAAASRWGATSIR